MRRNTAMGGLSLISLMVILLGACIREEPLEPWQASNEASAYTLLSTVGSPNAYLIDKQGRIVHQWETKSLPGQTAYLLENGHLLKTGSKNMQGNGIFSGGGAGGVVEEYDWDGQRVWRFEYDSDEHLLHHGLERLPNGNVLMIAWERKSREEAIAAGRDPSLVSDQGMWPDHIIEVEPSPPEGGRVVWEWHVWDHLIQESDPALPNYGKVAEHPERIHVNPPNWVAALSDTQREELGALGYLTAAPEPERRDVHPDWNHINAVAYNAELDQITLSVLGLNEMWIIDHGTTTQEARGNTGGRYGKGGDLLYRWGNPAACGSTQGAQTLFAQHDVHWISEGLPGAGHVLVFNNGRGRPDGDYSSVDELELPVTSSGEYKRDDQGGFAPARVVWSHEAADKRSFYSPNVSGSQRLLNGNTLICSGAQGRIFEVTPARNVVWEFALLNAGAMPGPLPAGGLRNLFNMLDTDKSGSLSEEEFSKLPGPGGPGIPGPQGMPGRGPGGNRGPMPQGPGGFGSQPGMPPRGPGGPEGMGNMRRMGGPGGPPGNQIFRASQYAPDYVAFEGKDLRPIKEPDAKIGSVVKRRD